MCDIKSIPLFCQIHPIYGIHPLPKSTSTRLSLVKFVVKLFVQFIFIYMKTLIDVDLYMKINWTNYKLQSIDVAHYFPILKTQLMLMSAV